MGFVPPQTIQKFLTINADLIQNQAFEHACELGLPAVEEGFVLLSTTIPTKLGDPNTVKVKGFARDDLTDDECQQIVMSQHKLLDSNNTPNYPIFNELFGPVTDIKKKYANMLIRHKLLISLRINTNKALEADKEAINLQIDDLLSRIARDGRGNLQPLDVRLGESLQRDLDAVNEKIANETKSYNYEIILEDINSLPSIDKKLFFDNIAIINKSKDAYTATSNYQVSMKFLFDDVNSLLNKIVPATCLDPSVPAEDKIKQIPLLKILHSYLDSNISNTLSNAVDLSKGILLVQECFLDGTKIFDFYDADAAPAQSVKFQEGVNKFNIESFTDELEDFESDRLSDLRKADYFFPYSNLFFTRKAKNGKIQGITKCYHLQYHKHNFDLFKDKNSIISDLKNSITMDFVSFEADSSTNKQKTLATSPPIISNLYQLLNTTSAKFLFSKTSAFSKRLSTLSTALEKINEASAKIGSINQAINIYNTYQSIIDSKNQELISEVEKEFASGGKFFNARSIKYVDSQGAEKTIGAPIAFKEGEAGFQSIETLKQQIDELSTEIKNIKNSINKALVFYILETSRRYSVLVPYKSLQTYDELTTFEAFKQKISLTGLIGNYTTATGIASTVGAAGASATGVTAKIAAGVAGAGAVLGVAAAVGYAGYALNEALTAEDIKGTDLTANKAREFLLTNVSSSVVIDDNFRSSLDFLFLNGSQQELDKRKFKSNMIPIASQVSNFNVFFTDSTPSFVSYVADGKDVSGQYKISSATNPEDIAKAILEFGSIEARERDGEVNAFVDLKFIFFGDLVSLLLRAESENTGANASTKGRIKIFMGGKTINDTANNKKSYLNYYFFPISVQALTNFLNDKILNSENLSYSTELFIKEIFENIVKGAITSTSVADRTQNLFIPSGFKNIVFNCFYDDSPEDVYSKYFRKFNSELNNTARHADLLNVKSDGENFVKFLAEFNFAKNLINCVDETKLCKVFCFYSDDQNTGINFYDKFQNSDIYKKTSPKPGWDSVEFTNFLNKEYRLPTIITKFPTMNVFTITYSAPTLNFSRVDNSNLTTGNLLGSHAIFRYPYSFSSDSLIGYMNFFMGVGSMFFITPPVINTEEIGTQEIRQLDQNMPNTFGFGGLYVIKSTSFTAIPSYRRPEGLGNTDEAAQKYKFSIDALHVGYGDGGSVAQDAIKVTQKSVSEDAYDFVLSVKGKLK